MGCVWIVRLCYCGFGLAEATLSPTRISRHPDQTGNLHSVVHEKGDFTRPHKSLQDWSHRPCLCALLQIPGPSEKPSLFLAICPFRVYDLLLLTSQSTHRHPFFPHVKMDCFSCVWLSLDSSQQYLISTVPVEPVGAALEASILSSSLILSP